MVASNVAFGKLSNVLNLPPTIITTLILGSNCHLRRVYAETRQIKHRHRRFPDSDQLNLNRNSFPNITKLD